MRLSIVGSGNLAYHLFHAFKKTEHQLDGIVVRDKKEVDWAPTGLISEQLPDSDIILLAITDSSIRSFSDGIGLKPHQIILHCSGAENMDSLDHHVNHGVFYPLQTFTIGRELSFDSIPILVEGSNKQVESKIIELAETLSNQVIVRNSAERKFIHAAAVMANNFSNDMINWSSSILKQSGEDLSILRPLMKETIAKAFDMGPEKAQTGPAKRGDKETIGSHLELLKTEEERNLYLLLSEHIQRMMGQ